MTAKDDREERRLKAALGWKGAAPTMGFTLRRPGTVPANDRYGNYRDSFPIRRRRRQRGWRCGSTLLDRLPIAFRSVECALLSTLSSYPNRSTTSKKSKA
jgi:hypothetical protein